MRDQRRTKAQLNAELTALRMRVAELEQARSDQRLDAARRDDRTLLLDSVNEAVIAVDPSFRIQVWNRAAESIYGWRADEVLGLPVAEVVKSAPTAGLTSAGLCHALQTHRHWSGELVQVDRNGREIIVAASARAIGDAPDLPTGYVLINRDITARKRIEGVLEAQHRFFELLATGAPLREVLEALVHKVESQIDGGLCSILLLDEQGRYLRSGAAPSLPAAYARAIDGVETGPDVGSCGAAVFRGTRVIVADIATDPLWVNFRDLALVHGLRACWSVPFRDSYGRILGTFAVYYREPRSPTNLELEEVQHAAYLASVAVERKRGEDALRASERRYRGLAEAIPLIVWTATPNGDIDYYNQRWFDYGGIDLEQTSNPSWYSPIHPDDRQPSAERWNEALRTGTLFEIENRIKRADGAYRWHLNRAVPVRDEQGEIAFWVGTATDIDDQKRAQEALRESEMRYRLVSRATNDVIWDWDMVNQTLEWNECAQTLFGYSADQVGSYPLWWDEHLHPDDLAQATTGVLATVENGGQFWSAEYRFRRADQTYAHILDRAYLLRDQAGVAIRMIGAMQDITARKEAEDALRTSEEFARRFQEHLKQLHALSIELSEAGSLDELCRLAIELGRSRLGFDRLGLWLRDDDPRFMRGSFGTDEQGQIRDERRSRQPIALNQLLVDLLAGKRTLNFNEEGHVFNDKQEPVGRGWMAMAALWDGDRVTGYISADNLLRKQPISQYQLEILALYGSTLGHLCVRKRAEQELEQRVAERTAQVEAVNKELEAFSYSVSHDLRAPLRHIDGFARLLAQREGERLDETSTRYLRVIGDAARKMGQLIDDLLSFSRMSRTEMQDLPVDLEQVVETIRHELAPAIEGRDIDWEIEPLPVVCGDPAMIKLVFINLLSNAIKYTAPRRKAWIAIGAVPCGEEETLVTVRDNGVGFNMEYVHKLFGVFQRLHRDEDFEGTGIGLATVRRIISRHGGRVWAEGALERGAVFHLTLKRHRSDDADEENLARGR
jgi:PAS domain S-box-containing protein